MLHPDKSHSSWENFPSRNNLNKAVILNEDMLGIIRAIQEQEIQTHGTLRGRCRDLSFKIAEITGLGVEDGIFFLDKPSGHEEIIQRHWWNIDGRGIIVGASEQQFNSSLEKPFPNGIVVLSPQDTDYWRYLPLDHPIVRRHARVFYWD